MPKISNRDLYLLPRIRIWLDDYQYLNQLFGDSEMGFSSAIREILSKYVAMARASADRIIDTQDTPANNLPTDDEILEIIRK